MLRTNSYVSAQTDSCGWSHDVLGFLLILEFPEFLAMSMVAASYNCCYFTADINTWTMCSLLCDLKRRQV